MRDEASIQVVEAILVAILVLSGVLFFTLITRPVVNPSATTLDLSQFSTDTLQVLANTPIADPTTPASTLDLEGWVDMMMRGGADAVAVADNVEAVMDQLIEPGTAWMLRLDTGYGQFPLAPSPEVLQAFPREAFMGSIYVLPDWRGNSNSVDENGTLQPGDEYDWSSFACVIGPTGLTSAPHGQTWLETWDVVDSSGRTRIPADLPFGKYTGTTDVACLVSPQTIHVAPREVTDLPPYGLQLVVWVLA